MMEGGLWHAYLLEPISPLFVTMSSQSNRTQKNQALCFMQTPEMPPISWVYSKQRPQRPQNPMPSRILASSHFSSDISSTSTTTASFPHSSLPGWLHLNVLCLHIVFMKLLHNPFSGRPQLPLSRCSSKRMRCTRLQLSEQ